MVFICRATFDSDFLEEEFHAAFGWLVEQGSTWCVILLSPVVVSSIVICAGRLHSSTHWHTYILQQHALCGGVYTYYNYNCILYDIYTYTPGSRHSPMGGSQKHRYKKCFLCSWILQRCHLQGIARCK